MPAGFINRVRDWQQMDMEFMAGIAGRVDERLAVEGFGCGISDMKEVECHDA